MTLYYSCNKPLFNLERRCEIVQPYEDKQKLTKWHASFTLLFIHTHTLSGGREDQEASPPPPHRHIRPPLSCPEQTEQNETFLTAKDGRSQVLDAGDGGGQACNNAHDPVKEGGVGRHGQDGGLAAADLLALDHHSEAHAEVVRSPQGGHHSATHEPGGDGNILGNHGAFFKGKRDLSSKGTTSFHSGISHVNTVSSGYELNQKSTFVRDFFLWAN